MRKEQVLGVGGCDNGDESCRGERGETLLSWKQTMTSEEVTETTQEVLLVRKSSILQHCRTIKMNEDNMKWGSMNTIMCGGPHERTGLGGWGVCSIMHSGARDDVIYRSTKRNRDWAVCEMASLKTSRENNSHLLRCFIEPKYLKIWQNNAPLLWQT